MGEPAGQKAHAGPPVEDGATGVCLVDDNAGDELAHCFHDEFAQAAHFREAPEPGDSAGYCEKLRGREDAIQMADACSERAQQRSDSVLQNELRRVHIRK